MDYRLIALSFLAGVGGYAVAGLVKIYGYRFGWAWIKRVAALSQTKAPQKDVTKAKEVARPAPVAVKPVPVVVKTTNETIIYEWDCGDPVVNETFDKISGWLRQEIKEDVTFASHFADVYYAKRNLQEIFQAYRKQLHERL